MTLCAPLFLPVQFLHLCGCKNGFQLAAALWMFRDVVFFSAVGWNPPKDVMKVNTYPVHALFSSHSEGRIICNQPSLFAEVVVPFKTKPTGKFLKLDADDFYRSPAFHFDCFVSCKCGSRCPWVRVKVLLSIKKSFPCTWSMSITLRCCILPRWQTLSNSNRTVGVVYPQKAKMGFEEKLFFNLFLMISLCVRLRMTPFVIYWVSLLRTKAWKSVFR